MARLTLEEAVKNQSMGTSTSDESGSIRKRSNLPPKRRFPYAGGRLSAVGYQLSKKHKALKAKTLLSCRKPKADCRLPGSRVLDRSFSRCRAAFPDGPELARKGNSLAHIMGKEWQLYASELKHRMSDVPCPQSRTFRCSQSVGRALRNSMEAIMPIRITCRNRARENFEQANNEGMPPHSTKILEAYCADRKPTSASYADQSMHCHTSAHGRFSLS